MTIETRLHALDAVRSFALLLGVVHHATLSFIPGAAPGVYAAVTDVSPSVPLAIVSFTGHTFRMSLFFMMAGFFAHLVIQRKGLAAFCMDRIRRIFVPLVLAWIIFFPLVAAAWSWGMNGIFLDSLLDLWPPSVDRFPLSYLWFLYYLLVIYVLALGVRAALLLLDPGGHTLRVADSLVRYVVVHRWAGLLLLTAPLCVALLVTESGWHIIGGIITPNRSLVPQSLAVFAYGMAFALGWMLHRNVAVLTHWREHWRGYLVAAVAATTLCVGLATVRELPIADVVSQMERLTFAACYAFACWCWMFGITGAALRFLSEPNANLRYVADASYWVYLVHYPIIIALQDVFATVPLHWVVKFPLILAATLGVSFVTYHYLVRSTFLGRMLNGRSVERTPRPSLIISTRRAGSPIHHRSR